MRKLFLVILIVCACPIMKAQNTFVSFFLDDFWLANNLEGIDLGINYSYMNADNSFSYDNVNRGSWNSIGLNFSLYADDYSTIEFFFNDLLAYSWAEKNDNYMLSDNISFNMGYKLPFDSLSTITLLSHVGIGLNFDYIKMSDKYSYYYDEQYYQITGCIPVGVKLRFKRFFLDYTYMVRFARSKIKHKDSDDDIYIGFSKSANNMAQHIKTFPFVISIGMCF